MEGLSLISTSEAQMLEPHITCAGALLSSSTGILDSAAYMLSLRGDIEDFGGVIAFNAPFERAKYAAEGFEVLIGGAESIELNCRILVNSAGLHASKVARAIEGVDSTNIPLTLYAKGNYFALDRRVPFSRLIYPAPQAHGLGVHLTFDLGLRGRFGPDVEWVDTIDYTVSPERGRLFYDAIRRYWPALPDNSLQPAYCGIRPKIAGAKEMAPNFRIDGVERHGIPGLINLFGIESPGLTSSLAIAEAVADQLIH